MNIGASTTLKRLILLGLVAANGLDALPVSAQAPASTADQPIPTDCTTQECQLMDPSLVPGKPVRLRMYQHRARRKVRSPIKKHEGQP